MVFAPLTEDGPIKAGRTTVHGVAWNDGTAPITEVEVSADGGRHWQAATVEKASDPYAWQRWKTVVHLHSGDHVLMARATDAKGRTQPLDGTELWDPKGYEWHGVDRVKVRAA